MKAKMMRKMQVPAYCPVPEGAHCVEKSGVEVEEKKVIIISDIPIIFVELEGVGGIFILPVDDELPQHKSRKPMVSLQLFVQMLCMLWMAKMVCSLASGKDK